MVCETVAWQMRAAPLALRHVLPTP
jgi:hypothetical protein